MIQILSFFASGDNCKRWPLWTGLVHHSWRPCSSRLWWLAVGCCCQLRRDNRSIIINVAWPSRTFKIIPWKNIYEKPDPHHYTTLNLYFRVFLFSKHAQPYTHSIPSAAGPDVQSKGRAWNVALEYARHRSGGGGCRLFVVFLLLNFNCFVFLNQEGDSNSPKAQAHVLSYNSSGSIKWLRLLHQRESYWKCINCRETSNAERERVPFKRNVLAAADETVSSWMNSAGRKSQPETTMAYSRVIGLSVKSFGMLFPAGA